MGNLNPDKISSIISIAVAITILISSFFQWHDITFNGKMLTRKWIKLLFSLMIVFLLIALLLIIL
jgi:hypothetical protein